MNVTKIYNGKIFESNYGEDDYAVFIHDENSLEARKPIAEIIQEEMEESGHFLSVRYIVSDIKIDPASFNRHVLEIIYGAPNVEYRQHYSDCTGYLWTDQSLQIGGHDLLDELTQRKGMYCLLEVTYSKTSFHEGFVE